MALDGQCAGQRHTYLRRNPHRLPLGADRGPLPDPVSWGRGGGEVGGSGIGGAGGGIRSRWEARSLVSSPATKGSRALCRTPQSRPSLTPAPSRRGLSSTDFPLGARSLPPSRDPSVLCSLPQRGTWDSKESHRPSLLPPVRRKKVLIRSFPPFASLTCSFLHSPESFGQMFEARCWPGHWGQRGAMSLLSGCWGRQARRWISQGSLVGVGTTEKVCRGAAQG